MRDLLLAAVAAFAVSGAAQAQNIQYVGQINTFAFNFCPNGFLPTNGALVSTSTYSILFSLIGTTYGGDGASTFGVPNNKPLKTKDKLVLTQCIAYLGVFPSRD